MVKTLALTFLSFFDLAADFCSQGFILKLGRLMCPSSEQPFRLILLGPGRYAHRPTTLLAGETALPGARRYGARCCRVAHTVGLAAYHFTSLIILYYPLWSYILYQPVQSAIPNMLLLIELCVTECACWCVDVCGCTLIEIGPRLVLSLMTPIRYKPNSIKNTLL